jgi:hypothetical protein
MLDVHIRTLEGMPVFIVINDAVHNVDGFPAVSHYAYMFSEMTFAVYSSLRPSGNSIS